MLKTDDIKFQEIGCQNIKNEYIYDIHNIEKECFSNPWSENAIKDAINNDNSYFIIACANEKLIGYGGMYFVCGEGYVYNIAVQEEYRKLKIGSRILSRLIEYSERLELKFLSLEVRESNLKAINLYRKYGFKEVGKRKNFYDFPKENAIIMTKDLKSEDVILYENTSNRNIV